MALTGFLTELNISIIVIFLFYKVFIANDTHFKLNRFFLLAGLFISLIISIPVLHYIVEPKLHKSQVLLEPILVTADSMHLMPVITESQTSYLAIIYIIGILLFTMHFFYKTIVFVKFLKKGNKNRHVNYIEVELQKNISPFSFFQFVFINRTGLNQQDVKKIIEHELIHVQQKHSIDLLLVEMFCIFLWFNPFIWLYKKAIRENHEFLADESVLYSGFPFEKYKQIILNQLFRIPSDALAHNFIHSLTKKRFKMMTKKKSNRLFSLKTLIIVPVIAIMFILFAFNIEKSLKTEELTDTTSVVDDTVYYIVDEMPEFQGGVEAFQQFISENVVYPEIAKKLKITGKVYINFVIDENGKVINVKVARSASHNMKIIEGTEENPSPYDAAIALDNEALRVFKLIPDWTPGKMKGKNVKVHYTAPINFELN